jgi:hypothetical protein
VGGVCGGAVICACGDVVTANRTLVPDLDPVTLGPCPGSGLRISPGVTLDLGESTIRGTGNGTGILLLPGAGSTVTRGRIAGFRTGVSGAPVTGATVSHVQVVDSGVKGIRLRGRRNLVTRCIARRTDAGAGIHLQGTDNVASLCRVEDSALGIVAEGRRTVVARNLVYRSRLAGIIIDGHAAVADRNRAEFTADGPGLALSGTGHLASRNILADNAGHGLDVSATASAFDRNRSSANDGWGIADASTGEETAGTANTYTLDVCTGNALGHSSPPGLCR